MNTYIESNAKTPKLNELEIQNNNCNQENSWINLPSSHIIEQIQPEEKQDFDIDVTENVHVVQDTTNKVKLLGFVCNNPGCNKSYMGLSSLNNHMKKKHSGTSIYQCDECLEKFNSTHQRTMHKLKNHEGRRYQTLRYKSNISDSGNEINKTINLLSYTTNNSQSQNQELIIYHTCQICNENFNQTIDLTRHMKNQHTSYPCSDCSKVFYTLNMFNEHRSLHDHSIPKYTCKICSKEFLTQRKLKEHFIIHNERIIYKCNVCAKVFLRSQTLQYHRTICKAEYPCDLCVDSFMTNESLEKHKLFHKNEQFICSKCNKIFSNQQLLKNHEKRHSIRMNYTCQICKETVSTRAKFEKHIKNHLETNLKCTICDTSFQSLVKYGYHKAEMHSILRPYNCLLCTDNFCTRHELFIHLHNHTDINTHVLICPDCGLKFSSKETYETHQQTHKEITLIEKDVNVVIKPIITSTLNGSSNNLDCIERENVVIMCDVEKRNAKLKESTSDLIIKSNSDNINNETSSNLNQIQNDEFKCDVCKITFEYQTLLNHHRNTVHEIKKYPCTIGFCDQIYKTIDELKQHKLKHNQIDENLEKYKSNKTINNLYACTIDGCVSSFEFESKLKRHMLSHILKEYKCNKCQRIYYSNNIYNKHIKYCSTYEEYLIADEINLIPIECSYCRQLFENKNVLEYHHNFCTQSQILTIKNK